MELIPADRIFTIDKPSEFERLALEIFHYQSRYNPVYKKYLELLNILPQDISSLNEIPFLPIEFFKQHRLITGVLIEELVFESSGTTADTRSKHYVADASLYRQGCTAGFQYFYGPPEDYCILALLPAYLERKDSSLVFMADNLIRLSGHDSSGFYLDNLEELVKHLEKLEQEGEQVLLLGVSFALLDLAERFRLPLQHTILMETGGMKGQREEITRQELHDALKDSFGLKTIHSEYGMTELLSQAYSQHDGIFHTPPWMRILIRDPYDPLSSNYREGSGGINIIDLVNIHSCSFIATQDIGKLTPDGGFEVLGRFDHSDIRGCNLLFG